MIFPLVYIGDGEMTVEELAPTANFTASQYFVFTNDTVIFTDTSIGNPTSWKWYSNGVLFSTVRNPMRAFSSSGLYEIRLEVSNAYGTDTITRSIECIGDYGEVIL